MAAVGVQRQILRRRRDAAPFETAATGGLLRMVRWRVVKARQEGDRSRLGYLLRMIFILDVNSSATCQFREAIRVPLGDV
jgi:hypothetical protein